MALQRRRAHAVAIDDTARVYEAIEELATDVLASGARFAIMRDDRLLKVLSPFGPQRVVVFFRLVAEDLCAKHHSDAIDAGLSSGRGARRWATQRARVSPPR